MVVERDDVPAGSTALSAGPIPAAGTRFQRDKGIPDSPDLFAADIQRKAKGEADRAVVETVAAGAAPLVEWLANRYGLPFEVVDNFNYPGHSAMRMHGLASRTGQELIDRLRSAAEANDIVILVRSTARRIFADSENRIRGVEVVRRDGSCERIGCKAMILACNGFGGNPDLVRRHIPEMAEALYFGHPGNQGDAIIWGDALGAQLSYLGAYQGHGSVATPHNILITWATIMEGGIQINGEGRRFCDETHGYSEQAAEVLRQPGGFAWTIFDARIAEVARQFDDFQKAESAGRDSHRRIQLEVSRARCVCPLRTFEAEWNEVEKLKSANGQDRYGRKFSAEQACKPPFHAVKVTGALFHTQGGLGSIQKDGSSAGTEGAFPTCSRLAARPPACRARQRRVIFPATAF